MLKTLLLASYVALVYSTAVTDIQGVSFKSLLAGQSVSNVTGIVTAKVETNISSIEVKLISFN